ncbi:MAG: hypothetical protein QOF11_1638 [Chloroflexota bacterium]|jgi:hypothetical protein|nr:hypothetical protein [Chloroflexota bacterium]
MTLEKPLVDPVVSRRNRIGGLVGVAKRGRRGVIAPAQAAAFARFELELLSVDPTLADRPDELRARAKYLQRAHMLSCSNKSAAVRRARKNLERLDARKARERR